MFKSAAIDICKSCLRMRKLLILWIALSTCILCLAILLVLISSSFENCACSPRKGGVCSTTHLGVNYSQFQSLYLPSLHHLVPIISRFHSPSSVVCQIYYQHKVLKQKLSILVGQCQSSLYQCYGFCRLKR